MMGLELVIFDCDGVLVDSEPIANRILAEMLSELGVDMGYEETLRTFVGRSMSSCLSIIEQRLGRPVPDGFVRAYNERSFTAFERELQPVSCVTDALDAIRVPVCVASSASHEKMRKTLEVTGLLERFDGRMFSATEVGRGKPDPALFLHAARKMGASPQRTAVIEDTVVGVQAGKAAGMVVYAYFAGSGQTDGAELAREGAVVFDDMRRLPRLLEGFEGAEQTS